jgi:flagellar biosynthesis protein FliR
MIVNADLAAAIIRISVFCAVLGLLPRLVVPVAARVAFALVLYLFVAPAVLGISSGSPGVTVDFAKLVIEVGASDSRSQWSGDAILGYQRILSEVGVGIFLAVSLSTALYAVELFSVWIGLFFSNLSVICPFERIPARGATIRGVVVLVAMSILFSTGGISAVFELLARSLVLEARLDPFRDGAIAVIKPLMEAGSNAFAAGLLFAFPVALASIFVNLLFILYRRCFEQAFSDSLAASARLPVLILVVSLILYPFSAALSEVIHFSLAREQGEYLLRLLYQ